MEIKYEDDVPKNNGGSSAQYGCKVIINTIEFPTATAFNKKTAKIYASALGKTSLLKGHE